MRNKKSGFRKGFRKMNNKKVDKYGHPTYVYAKIGDDYKYIGITHSPITKGVRNIKLEVNPDPKDMLWTKSVVEAARKPPAAV